MYIKTLMYLFYIIETYLKQNIMKNYLAFFLFCISSIANAQVFEWAKSFGGSLNEMANSIAVDAAGNIYLTGRFQGTVDFNPEAGVFNMTSFGLDDIFIVKLTTSGSFVWAKQMGGTSIEDGNSIAVDNAGNIYLTGLFDGTTDFDPSAAIFNYTAIGNSDIFVVKLDSDGNFIWAKQMGGSGEETGICIALDLFGNVYTIGNFQGTADFDPGVNDFTVTSSNIDVYISKLDSDGNFVWAKKIGGSSWDVGYFISTDSNGNLYTTGHFSGVADFDPNAGVLNLSSAGGTDVFVCKLDGNGNFLWAKKMGGAQDDRGNSLGRDALNNVYITGYFRGIADFDPSATTFNLTAGGNRDIFVCKIDSVGNFVWAKSMGDIAIETGQSIATDSNGNCFITGTFASFVDFDPGPNSVILQTAGNSDVFIQKLDSSGNFVWVKKIGAISADVSSQILVDSNGGVLTIGKYVGIVDFDPDVSEFNLTSAGDDDVFILKLGNNALSNYRNTYQNASLIYPNPSIGIFTIETNIKAGQVDIYNLIGKKIFTATTHSKKVVIDISKEPKGVYFLTLEDEKGNLLTQKIVLN